jgi:predicted PurR-regulated permease PerM
VSADGGTARRSETAAYVLVAVALLFVFRFHLVTGLVAGLLLHTLLHRSARLLSGPRLSHGAARWLAAVVVALAGAGLTALAAVGLASFARGTVGDLPGLYARMADVLDDTRRQLAAWGVSTGALEGWQTADQVKAGLADWLREHSAELRSAGGEAGRTAIHVLMGIVAALLVFFRRPAAAGGAPPFAAALAGRIRRFAEAFERIVIAQVEISAVNTTLTAVYLFAVVPLLAERLPFSGTLILVTFVAGLLPVVGNLVSNTAIVVLSFGTAPWLALVSLGFLVGVHKLEYLVNARIVGNRIGAEAWEIFLSIVVLEVAFGIPGVVLAPVLYAWAKGELREKELV